MKVELSHMLRFGYFIMIVTILLMMWASFVGAIEIEHTRNPCSFNPLCTCSKTPPDLGMVECRLVPFAEIPPEINNSKVFSLHMERTGLQTLQPYFLRPTGLYRLEITENPIQHIPDEAFIGLDRSLSILKLTYNQLVEIPSQAMRHLRKLQYIDLTGNHISDLRKEAWRGLEDSLQTIILTDNLIPGLPTDAFSSLPLLETIDLSGNNIMEIEKDVFRDGMARLKNVILADNLLATIPYTSLSPLKALTTLDISYNRITGFAPEEVELTNVKLNLNILHLEYNQITSIPPESFQYFDVLNVTYLDGNPISVISEGAFQKARIRELYIRNCKLHFISPEAFTSLESSLQVLDLSGNNITTLPEKVFSAFDSLKVLNLRDNKLTKLMPIELFLSLQSTLHKLDLTGDNMPGLTLQELRRLRNLRSLAVSKLLGQSIGPEDFLEFGYELEDLKIYKAGLKSIRNNAFREVRSIKRLDLSENNINSFEENAFKEIGHSLTSLRISHGLSMDTLPVAAFKVLKSLEELDLTNNRLNKIPDTSFHNLKNLKVVEMHDNAIEQLSKGTFQGDLHHHLELVSFAFNNIRLISQHTFVDLRSLQKIRLEDNKIERIERKAFMNLDKIRTINMRGNKINSISDEAFQGDYENRQEFCRICCKTGMKLRHLFIDEKLQKEIMTKIHVVFPHILIYKNDPLPKGLCEGCELFIHATYEKLVEFNRAQQELVTREIDITEDADYLKTFRALNMLMDRIKDLKLNLLTKSKQCFGQVNKQIDFECLRNTELKSLLLKDLKVKTLKRLCIDFFNQNGPNLLETYLKYDLEPLDEEMESEDEVIVIKSKVKNHNNHKVGFDSNSDLQDGNKPQKISSNPHEPESNPPDGQEIKGPATRRRSRALSRVNYVDDIPDAVLFYDEIQAAKRRKLEEKAILDSIKEASKRQQLSPPHRVVPPLVIKINENGIFKTNPESQIKINSAISVKPCSSASTSTNLTETILDDLPITESTNSQIILNPENLFFEHDIMPAQIVDIKTECSFCGLICDNLKILALHNNEHLKIRATRIGEKLSLPANLRRGAMLVKDNRRVVQCTSCLKTFMNAAQIKDHWSSRNCNYYCFICYEVFHRNPHRLKDHILSAHGIEIERDRKKTEIPIKSEPGPLKQLENMAFNPRMDRLNSNQNTINHETASQSSTGGFKLKVKSVSMINASAGGLIEPTRNIPSPMLNQSVPPLHYPLSRPVQHATPPLSPFQAANQRAVCHICHCSFPNTNSRNSHMKVHKRPSELQTKSVEKSFVRVSIRPCGFKYQHRAEFLQHRLECTNCRYSCTLCPKSFQSGSELQMHLMLSHPFKK
uniref:CSON002513 protein n=1 Tax=Culicoides sonorensis TaxID=179676 RepID=A0A336KC85_CULSO